jgi:peptidoglycan/LPS O-acetylase OafA/YrhL
LLALPLTYGLAWLSWHWIEEPCLRGVRARRQHADAVLTTAPENVALEVLRQ